MLVLLAVPWCLLWLGVTFLENPGIVHDRTLPFWQPAVYFGSSGLAAAGLLILWHVWTMRRTPSAAALGPWFRSQLLPLPLSIAVVLGLTYGLRLSVFAAAGAAYRFNKADSVLSYQIIKISIFYLLWIGLALAARLVTEAREQRRALNLTQDALSAAHHLIEAHAPERRILVPLGDKLKPVEIDAICWIEADDNYVRIHTATQDYAVRKALQDILTELGEDRFVRIHRSAAINIGEIEAIKPLSKGDAEIRLKSGATLRMSRRFRDAVFRSHSPSH